MDDKTSERFQFLKGVWIKMEDKKINIPDEKEFVPESEEKLETATHNVQETKEPINIKKEIISWLLIGIVAFLLAKGITSYVIIKAIIPTNSMENTIMTGDRIIGNRLAYLFTSPKRGDIVIFKFPDDETQNYIKRIIGIPGDTVEIKDGSVYLYDSEGKLTEGPLDEPYIKEEMYTSGVLTFTVPEDSYFVLGDNRNSSLDARYWTNTFVHEDKILGKALFRYRPSLGWLD